MSVISIIFLILVFTSPIWIIEVGYVLDVASDKFADRKKNRAQRAEIEWEAAARQRENDVTFWTTVARTSDSMLERDVARRYLADTYGIQYRDDERTDATRR